MRYVIYVASHKNFVAYKITTACCVFSFYSLLSILRNPRRRGAILKKNTISGRWGVKIDCGDL